jgi:hypothetical protein
MSDDHQERLRAPVMNSGSFSVRLFLAAHPVTVTKLPLTGSHTAVRVLVILRQFPLPGVSLPSPVGWR